LKNLILVIALLFSFSGVALAQADQKKTAADKAPIERPRLESKSDTIADLKMELKDNKCSEAFQSTGHSIMIHGEKGHKCNTECKMVKTNKKRMEPKDHTCIEACKTTGYCLQKDID